VLSKQALALARWYQQTMAIAVVEQCSSVWLTARSDLSVIRRRTFVLSCLTHILISSSSSQPARQCDITRVPWV